MAFNVRVFGHRGIVQLPFVNPRQFSGDSVYVLMQPYEWSQVLTTNGATAVSSSAVPTPDLTQLIRIEVPDGQSIRYEINSPGRVVSAGNSSPTMSGITQLFFGTSWTISVVEAASFL